MVGEGRRICFGAWNDKASSAETVALQPNQAKLTMPAGSSTYTARCYAALFGAIAELETWSGRMQIGQSPFVCSYTHTECVAICHRMSFKLSDGEITSDAPVDHAVQDTITVAKQFSASTAKKSKTPSQLFVTTRDVLEQLTTIGGGRGGAFPWDPPPPSSSAR